MSYFDRLGDVDISGLRAKLDNSKMSKRPWHVDTVTISHSATPVSGEGDTFVSIVAADWQDIAWTETDVHGVERVTFDEDHAELAVAAVNVLPALLDYIETLRGELVKWRDNEMRAAVVGRETRREGAFALVAQLNTLIQLGEAT